MRHTARMKAAIQFALKKHDGQYRKEAAAWPYATHLILVGMLLTEADADEDTVIAGILHDTIEDTETSPEEIQEYFGARVRMLVEAVTEPKGFAWKEKKEAYLTQLIEGPDEALLISIADKIDNIESKLDAHAKEGPEIHKNWSQPMSAYFWFHGEVARMAKERLPENLLTKRLLEATARERAEFESV